MTLHPLPIYQPVPAKAVIQDRSGPGHSGSNPGFQLMDRRRRYSEDFTYALLV